MKPAQLLAPSMFSLTDTAELGICGRVCVCVVQRPARLHSAHPVANQNRRGVTSCGLLVLSEQVNVTLTCQVLCDSCSDGVGGDAAAVVTNTSSMDGSTSTPPKTVVIVGVAFGTVCLLGVVVALIFLRLKSTANKDEVCSVHV